MIAPLFGRLLRQHGRLFGTLALALFLFELFVIWIGSEMLSGPGIQQMVETLPPVFRELLNANFGVLTFDGAVALGFQHPLVLVAALAFVVAVATVPAAESESGFLDLVLARPVRRSQYLVAVLLVIVLAAAAFPAVQLVAIPVGLSLVDAPAGLQWTRYLPGAVLSSLLLLAVGGYTVLLASGARRRGSAVAWAVGLTLAFFWVDFVAVLWQPFELLSRFSPFHYFKPIQSVLLGRVLPSHVLVLFGIFVVTAAAALYRFNRRDL